MFNAQLLIGAVCVAVALLVSGKTAGAALAGVMMSLLATTIMSFNLFSKNRVLSTPQFLKKFYSNEIQKWLVVAVLLALAAQSPFIDFMPCLLSYAVCTLLHPFVAWRAQLTAQY